MKLKTSTHTTHTLTTDTGVEVDLSFEPVGDPLVHETIDTVIVAYMVHDINCDNPMTSNDGEGVLHMLRESRRHGYDSYNPEVLSALGLQSDGTPDIDAAFNHGTGFDTLRGLATLDLLADNPGLNLTNADVFAEHEDDIDTAAVNLYAKHWQAIAGPFVVPVASYNEGRVGVTAWDGDHFDLPDGVWLADEDVQGNLAVYPPGVEVGQIKGEDGKYTPEYELTDKGVQAHRGTLGACWEWMKANYTITDADRYRAIIKYADGVLASYSAWAEGECFGCTVEIFEHDGDKWVEAKESRDNEGWGYIGWYYAKEALRTEFFEPAVAALQTPV